MKDSRYTIGEFIESTKQTDKEQGIFELDTSSLLEINLNGKVWAMVSYIR